MKYLLGTITTLLVILSFTNRKCDHVFTEVEQATIKIERLGYNLIGGQGYMLPSWPTGLHEGKEIVCVKCFHVQKQILDYGPAGDNLMWSDTSFHFNSSNLIGTLQSFQGATLKIKGDSIIWSK